MAALADVVPQGDAPVNILSAMPRESTVSIIWKASEILAPPRINTQGRFGASMRPETVQYSFSKSRPMAEGSTCSKPQRLGWSRWAAAKASHT